MKPKQPGRQEARCARTLTPNPSPRGRGEPDGPDQEGRRARDAHYRGGFPYAGLVKKARHLRRHQTPAEEILWQMLRNRQFLDLKFRRQHQIGLYIADFYCHDARLVIELDGGIHRGSRKRDRWRDEDLETLGLTVLRIPNQQLLDDPEQVLDRIRQAAGPPAPET